MGTLGDITGQVYEAALNPGLWHSVLTNLSDTIGCLDIALCSYSIQPETPMSLTFGFMGGSRRDAEVHRLYTSHYASLAPMNKVSVTLPTGHMHFCHENVSEATKKRHEF